MANSITRSIPNTLTCCNLLSGCMAAIAAFNGEAWTALLWICAGALFDFCDGFAARLLKAYSPLGKELDSLADLITFGLAPSVLCWKTLTPLCEGYGPLAYVGFIIVVFSALRLAKFNTDERQTTSFMGLAVPADALFWAGLLQPECYTFLKQTPWVIIALAVVFSLLMVSDIPMFSLKFKSLKFSENKFRFIFLAGVILIMVLLGKAGISAVICWYILLSLLTKGQH